MARRSHIIVKTSQKHKKGAEPLELVLLISPYLIGLYYPWASALISLVLLGNLTVRGRREGLRLFASPLLLTFGCLVVFLLLGGLWGTDRGMALFGAVKFLPLPLYVLALQQLCPEERSITLRYLPFSAAGMVLLSLLLSRLPALSPFYLVNGRLAGFFQYPNSFAAWLLAALICCLSSMRRKNPLYCRAKAVAAVILILGILLTGSRAVFLLMLAELLWHCMRMPERRRRLLGLFVLGFFCASVAVAARLSGNAVADRLWKLSPFSSELVGRLLYARDAIPMILKHPLGLGYGGYRTLQGSFQTGVYSVLHVHNDLLQMLLDVGWVPAILFLWALVRAFRTVDGFAGRREMLFFLCLHALFDFDMQFGSLSLLLITCMYVEPAAEKTSPGEFIIRFAAVPAMFCLWIGLASFLFWCGDARGAASIAPFYTDALVQELVEADDDGTMENLAERVLTLNGRIALVHDAKAALLFSAGERETAIAEKEMALTLARYNREEYLDYINMLQAAYREYLAEGDMTGAIGCADRMRAVPSRIDAVLQSTSALGWRIQDQPDLRLPEDVLRQIRELDF